MSKTRTSCLTITVTAALLSGCASQDNSSTIANDSTVVVANTDAVNDHCAFTGKIVNPAYNLRYKNEVIGFCSAGTQAKFLAMKERERDTVLENALSPQ